VSPPNPRIITDPAELSREWLTMVLRGRGLNVAVSSLRSEPVGTGQMAYNERVFLEYEGDAADAPATLVGKFPSPSEESRAAAVDWQTLSVGCGGQDLAYLLGNSSPPEQRREHESHVLEVYRESMAELGIERSADEVYADFVYGSFQGPSITILGALFVGQTDRGDEMFMAMAHRATAQIRDLDALDLLA
jgi:hypothetical protein